VLAIHAISVMVKFVLSGILGVVVNDIHK